MAGKKVFLNMAQAKAVTEWAERNKAELAGMTRDDAIALCHADTGIRIPETRMRELEDICGVVRHRGGAEMVAVGNVRVIACELVRLMQQLDVKPSDPLTKIANR